MSTTTRCARCGREIVTGTYLCDRCREEEGPSFGARIRPPSDLEARAGRWPSWMPKPSPVQYHATVAVVILLVVAGLATFAFLSHRGVGPFRGHAVHTRFRPPSSLIVDAAVQNQGSKSSRANCDLTALVGGFSESSSSVLTAVVAPGGTVRFRAVLTGVNAPPTTVTVSCS